MKLFERIEERLLLEKKYNALTKLLNFEKRFHSSRCKKLQREWMNCQFREQLTGVAICEREIYLNEEIRALKKQANESPLSEEKTQQLKTHEEELANLDLEWWLHKRSLSENMIDRPKGPCVRHFAILEQVWPDYRKRQCKIRGGCCNFDCGCCESPRVCSRGTLETHCTAVFCGCCIRRRGGQHIPSENPNTYRLHTKPKPSDKTDMSCSTRGRPSQQIFANRFIRHLEMSNNNRGKRPDVEHAICPMPQQSERVEENLNFNLNLNTSDAFVIPVSTSVMTLEYSVWFIVE